VATSSYSEHSPSDLVLTMSLREMLVVARYGLPGGKPSHLWQGLYVSSTQTKQDFRFHCHFMHNIDANLML